MAISALRRRLGALPSQPFYTHYQGDARIELSAVTFANWVDKTCNMLEDLGVDAGEVVHLDLVRAHPAHWVSMVWIAACWQRGCTVSLDEDPAAVLTVSGPDALDGASLNVACSLHPLGMGFDVVPHGCIDYAEVLSQPDSHVAEPVVLDDVAVAPGITFRQVREVPPRGTRLLVRDPRAGWETIRDLLVAPLLGGGSTVVVMGGDDQLIKRLIVQERAELG